MNLFWKNLSKNIHFCWSCGLPVDQKGLCWKCWKRMQWAAMEEKSTASLLQKIDLPFELQYYFFLYFIKKNHPFFPLLYLLKYQNTPEVGFIFGRLLALQIPKNIPFVLIPVPLHPEKERLRGYNQSQIIAEGIAELTGLPIQKDWVSRIVNTSTQTAKTKIQRQENMKGVFQLNAKIPTNTHVLLIDDVVTTGSTLHTLGELFFQNQPQMQCSIATLATQNPLKI